MLSLPGPRVKDNHPRRTSTSSIGTTVQCPFTGRRLHPVPERPRVFQQQLQALHAQGQMIPVLAGDVAGPDRGPPGGKAATAAGLDLFLDLRGAHGVTSEGEGVKGPCLKVLLGRSLSPVFRQLARFEVVRRGHFRVGQPGYGQPLVGGPAAIVGGGDELVAL
jgi:hypothetical protein